MKQITIMLSEKDMEYALISLIKYRHTLMESDAEFSEKYSNSLSNTGYILEILKGQVNAGSAYEDVEVSLDVEMYMNICDILTFEVDELNNSIIDELKRGNNENIQELESQKEIYKNIYDKLNARRFKVLHV